MITVSERRSRVRRAGIAVTLALGVTLAGVAAPARATSLLETINLGAAVFGMGLSPDRSELWVTVNDSASTINDVAIIDPATNAVITRFEVETRPRGLAFTPDGSTVYVLSTFNNTAVPDAVLQAYSVATRTAVGSPIVVGNQGNRVVISADGTRAYVTNFGFGASGGSVSVVTLATGAVTSIPVGVNPSGLALTPSGSELWVVTRGDATVSVIDTATLTVVETMSTSGNSPERVAFSPDGSRAYVTGFSNSVLDVFDVATRTIIESIPTQVGPNDVTITPDGAFAYVTDFGISTLSLIDLETGDREEFAYPELDLAFGSLLLDAVGGRLYATEAGGGSTRLVVFEVDAFTPPGGQPAPELADTGAEATPIVTLTFLLLLVGGLALAIARSASRSATRTAASYR